MKTGQMLFVAFGGMLLGAAGTLAVQTGFFHYEVTLDIRPRGPLTVPPQNLQAGTADPYGPPIAQNWDPAPPPVENLPLAMPRLDDQQVAEIVSIREQIGPSISQRLTDLTGSPVDAGNESFADHLRAAADASNSSSLPSEQADDSSVPLAGDSLARGLREAQLR